MSIEVLGTSSITAERGPSGSADTSSLDGGYGVSTLTRIGGIVGLVRYPLLR